MIYCDELTLLRKFAEAWENLNSAYEHLQEFYESNLPIPYEEVTDRFDFDSAY